MPNWEVGYFSSSFLFFSFLTLLYFPSYPDQELVYMSHIETLPSREAGDITALATVSVTTLMHNALAITKRHHRIRAYIYLGRKLKQKLPTQRPLLPPRQ